MFAVVLTFGLPMFVAGMMLDPSQFEVGSLISYWAIMAVLLPFAAWPLFLWQLVLPTAGFTRMMAVLNVALGGPTLAVAVIYWLSRLLGYRPDVLPVDPLNRMVRYDPKAGIAIGLFGLSMLVSCGLWGAVAPVLRPQVALRGALVTGCLLFTVVYCLGWALVLT